MIGAPGPWDTEPVGDRTELAIACCRSADDADPADLYPDPDSELLVGALRELGLRARMVSWDDPRLAWDAFDLVVVRSTWDSVDRPDEYRRWAWSVQAKTCLINSAEVLTWNLDKSYLAELAGAGVPVVPTQFVQPGGIWSPPGAEFVLKPAISAGGRETARYGPDHHDEAIEHLQRLLGTGRTAMVQPYLPAVEDPGEISLVYLGGVFSHAVRKGPVLEAGAGVVERPWERMVYLGRDEPSPSEMTAAARVQATLEHRFGPLVYSRVDLVSDPDGQPVVIEVELVDPYLSLTMEPGAADRLAGALQRVAALARDSRSR